MILLEQADYIVKDLSLNYCSFSNRRSVAPQQEPDIEISNYFMSAPKNMIAKIKISTNLQAKIILSATESANEDQFIEKMLSRGVVVEKHRPDIENLSTYTYTYEVRDLAWLNSKAAPKSFKASSKDLGSDYAPDGVAFASQNPSGSFFNPPYLGGASWPPGICREEGFPVGLTATCGR